MSTSPVPSPEKLSQPTDLTTLLEYIAQELDVYRKRQAKNFRELVIVEALITWGIMQLKLGHEPAAWILRVVAALACAAATAIGMWIINSDRIRIYYLRDSRKELVQIMCDKSTHNIPAKDWFYPRDKTSLPGHYKTRATSLIYSLMLFIVGIFTGAVNILAGFVSK